MSHEDLKRKYEADAIWHPRPWELWLWGVPGGKICSGCNEVMNPAVDDDFVYRRKPDAPERNCAMCKHREAPLEDRAFTHCVKDNEKCICQACLGDKPHPDWCPLAQEEEPKQHDLLTAAHDLLEWLEGFQLMRGADKVKALREAVEEAEKQNQYNLCYA